MCYINTQAWRWHTWFKLLTLDCIPVYQDLPWKQYQGVLSFIRFGLMYETDTLGWVQRHAGWLNLDIDLMSVSTALYWLHCLGKPASEPDSKWNPLPHTHPLTHLITALHRWKQNICVSFWTHTVASEQKWKSDLNLLWAKMWQWDRQVGFLWSEIWLWTGSKNMAPRLNVKLQVEKEHE